MTHIDNRTLNATRQFRGLIDHHFHPLSVVLFGSRARGDFLPESDADVAVVLDGTRHESVRIALDLADAAYDVLLETGVNISPLPLWVDEWRNPALHPNPVLVQNIVREGVVL